MAEGKRRSRSPEDEEDDGRSKRPRSGSDEESDTSVFDQRDTPPECPESRLGDMRHPRLTTGLGETRQPTETEILSHTRVTIPTRSRTIPVPPSGSPPVTSPSCPPLLGVEPPLPQGGAGLPTSQARLTAFSVLDILSPSKFNGHPLHEKGLPLDGAWHPGWRFDPRLIQKSFAYSQGKIIYTQILTPHFG